MTALFRKKPLRALMFGVLSSAIVMCSQAVAVASEITPFVGEYEGSAAVLMADGSSVPRDMSVKIAERGDGYNVSWSSTSYRDDGRTKVSAFSIDFTATGRTGVFSAAMKRDVFGHAVQLDPMKGEPFVWGRILGETLTVYSLFVDAEGGYELQQFDRTLAEGGLDLDFSRVSNGTVARSVNTFLKKQ